MVLNLKRQATSLRQCVNWTVNRGMLYCSSQQKGKYDQNRQTKRHRRVLQRSRQDGHHPTPSGGKNLERAHGYPERGPRSYRQRASQRGQRKNRIREVESFSGRNQKIIITAPARAGACDKSSRGNMSYRHRRQAREQATSDRRQATCELALLGSRTTNR